MSQNGYTRQSAAGIVTGATILASGLNAEYNQIVSAFDNTVGHRHDGSVTGGGAYLVPASLTSITSSSAGLVCANGSNGFNVATITGTSGYITVTNGTGASANPTITIDSTYVGQTSITTLGTITTGTWTGTTIAIANGGTGSTSAGSARTALGLAIGTNVEAWSAVLDTITANTGVLPAYGGTGINNGSYTTTLGGNISTAGVLTTAGAFITSGANSLTLTTTGTTNITLPTSGTLVNTAVTTLSSLTSIGTIGTGVWQGTVVGATYGGTGVNNGSSTITIGGNHTLSGAYTSTFTFTGVTSVTFPTSGTLATTAVTTLSSLTSIGTIGTGVWQGTAVAPTYGGTGQDTHTSTGVAQVNSGTWSISTALANGTTATTQSSGDNSTKVATTAYVNAAIPAANVYQSSVTSPSSTTSTTAVMAGLAGPLTPNYSGKVFVQITGQIQNSNSNTAVSVQGYWGTGTAPTNGAAFTGTTFGGAMSPQAANSGAKNLCFTCSAILTGLTLSTAIWVDLGFYGAGATTSLNNVSISMYEIK